MPLRGARLSRADEKWPEQALQPLLASEASESEQRGNRSPPDTHQSVH